MDTISRLVTDIVPEVLMILMVLKSLSNEKNITVKIKNNWNESWKLIVATIILMFSYRLFYNNSIGILVTTIPLPDFINEAFEEIMNNKYYMYISIILVGPILEELVMRGILLQGFLNKYKPVTAILISALLFGSIHMNMPQFINATIIGLIFGYIYYRTDSVFLCIIGHMANNAFAFVEYDEWMLWLLNQFT